LFGIPLIFCGFSFFPPMSDEWTRCINLQDRGIRMSRWCRWSLYTL
jgi:hypothetical protein